MRVWTTLALLTLAACGADRDRPSPPQLSIQFSTDSVGPTDTFYVAVTATDPDGVDSVWLVVDSQPPQGDEGFLDRTHYSVFKAWLTQPHPRGQRIAVRDSARDTNGWAAAHDTFVVAKGP